MRLASPFIAAIILTIGTSLRAQTNDPSPNQFIDVQQEPTEKQPIERLIEYPEIARRNGLEGKVTLQALIDTDGFVNKVEVLHSDYDIFKDAAISAMKRAKFTPAMSDGTPLKVWITRNINFKLDVPRRISPAQNEEPQNHPRYTFGNMIGLNLDSARELFHIWGDSITETSEHDGLHLFTVSRPGFANNQFAITIEGIMGSNGLRELSLSYNAPTDEEFQVLSSELGIRPMANGTLLSGTSKTQYPSSIMTVTSNQQERQVEVLLERE